MSELRIVKFSEMTLIKPGLRNDKLYFKDEADKVIAEKDKEIQRLENLCESYRIDCDNLAITTDRMRTVGRTLREKMAHQKYRRCLAMANYWVAASYHCVDDKHRQKAEKRHYKWLELAEQFKEAK